MNTDFASNTQYVTYTSSSLQLEFLSLSAIIADTKDETLSFWMLGRGQVTFCLPAHSYS